MDQARRAVLTAHLAAGNFQTVYSLHGHWMHVVGAEPGQCDIDRLIQRYVSMHGNMTVNKNDNSFVVLAAMKAGEEVGILMDTNMTPPQGVFVNFFGIPACTASGLARIALRTDAAVVPGFTIWDPVLRKYRLRFDPAVNLVRTGDDEKAYRHQHSAFHENYRRLRPPLSRPVAVGTSALEDETAGGGGAVLRRSS